MRRRLLVRMILLAAFVGGLCLELQRLSAAQVHTNVALDSSSTADEKNAVENEQAPPTQSKLDEMTDRIIKREHDEITAFDLYTPIIETYIQEVKIRQLTGARSSSDQIKPLQPNRSVPIGFKCPATIRIDNNDDCAPASHAGVRGFESRRTPHAVLSQNEWAVHFIAKEVLRISLQ